MATLKQNSSHAVGTFTTSISVFFSEDRDLLGPVLLEMGGGKMWFGVSHPGRRQER